MDKDTKKIKRLFVFHEAFLHKRNREFWHYLKDYIPDIKLFTPKKWEGSLGEKQNQNVKIVENGIEIIPITWNYVFNIQLQLFVPSFSTYINLYKPDIVIFSEESYALSTFEFSLFYGNYPFLFLSLQNIYKKYPLPFNFFQNYVFKKSKGALVASIEAEEILRKKGFFKPTFKFYLGVDVKNFSKKDKIEEIEKLKKPVIAYSGRLTKIKGIYILLDAFYKFYKKYGKGTILFVGEGEERKNLERECKEKKINFFITGYIKHEEISKIYNSIDITVLPSLTGKKWKEQFGRVLVESMAAGVPVIGSNSGAIPETINNAGLIFKEGDTGALFKAIERLYLNQELKNELIEKGKKRVKENFTYEVISKKLFEFLKTISKNEKD